MKRGTEEETVKTADSDKSGTEPKKAKLEPPTTLTGRQIIDQYLKGDVASAVTYRKICNALEVFNQWESDIPKLQLLEQFLGIADALEPRTELLVTKLLALKWDKIPSGVLEQFRNFLCELAIRQLTFTETVYSSVIARFVPQMMMDEETNVFKYALDEKIQNDHYQMAHHIISSVVRCFPLSAKTLLRCLKKSVPHFTEPTLKVSAYIRNLILVQRYAPGTIAKNIWDIIFERVAKDDAHNWRCEQNEEENRSPSLFVLNDDIFINDVDTAEVEKVPSENRKGEQMMAYLDSACTDVITYIRFIHGGKDGSIDDTWLSSFKYTGDFVMTSDALFDMMKECLETTMLTAVHVKYTSFIWLYLCSLRTEYEPKILENLWQISCRMPRAPADAKKSQGAAAYIAAFLARANYINKSTAFTWLEELFEWLRRYVDQFGSGSSQILPGLQRHGTFYAIAQSFFLVFAFRYKEFAKNSEMMESIRRWGIGRVVHSPLEPLRFVSKPVARCFSAITRSLQLVYCNHIIPIEEVQRPFEDMFPFDSYNLKISSEFVVKLMRKFSPLAEDMSILTKALSWNAATAEKSEATSNGDVDFLDEDEFLTGIRERSGTCGQSSLINYSATPGLKSFGV